MSDGLKKDLVIYGGGALAVVLLVLAALWFTAPDDQTMPNSYAEQGFGVQ